MRGQGLPGIATREGGSVEKVDILDLLQGNRITSILEEERQHSVLFLARRNDPLGINLTAWQKKLSSHHPDLRVSTIHAAKGSEADTVLIIQESKANRTNYLSPTLELLGHEKRFIEDEEKRVEYVANTRARKRLIIAK